MSILRRLGPVSVFALLLTAVPAQTVFRSELDGAQETPPTSTTGSGEGRVVLDPATSVISVELSVAGLRAPVTGAHIHTGAVGTAGGVTLPLTGNGPVWTQSFGPLSAGQLADLRGNSWYFNVHTTAFPAGEIRGQITPAHRRFDAFLTAAKETPPTASPATGLAEFELLSTGELRYSLTATNLVGPPTIAVVHQAVPGIRGPGVFFMEQTGATTFAGTSAPLTDLQIAQLRAGLMYVNVHSQAFLEGEIRGQITPSFTDYGAGCAGAAGVPVLDGGGTPVPGASFTLDVTGGLTGGAGALLFAAGASSTSLGAGCTLLIDPAPAVVSTPVLLDPSGELSLPLTLAAATPTAWLQLQFAGFDPGSANGVFSLSNGLGLHVND